MGKGDLRSRKGKIYRGTHGNARPHKARAAATAAKAPAKKTASRKKPA